MIFPLTRCWVLQWQARGRADRGAPDGYVCGDDGKPVVFWTEVEALARARELAVHQRVWIEELTGKLWHCPKEVEPEVPK